MISNLLLSEANQYGALKLEYDRAILNYNRNYTYLNVLNKPFPADKKSYPIRWLIMLVSTVSALFLAVIVIMVMEKINAYNTQKNFQLGQS